GLAVGMLLGFFLADRIVTFIQSPLKDALEEYYRSAAREDLHKFHSNVTEADVDRVENKGMVFERVWIDPKELTDAPGITPSAVAVEPPANSNPQASLSPNLRPVLIWHDLKDDPRTHTKSLSGQEPFMIWIKAALVAGFVFSSPWIFYQLWMFIAA